MSLATGSKIDTVMSRSTNEKKPEMTFDRNEGIKSRGSRGRSQFTNDQVDEAKEKKKKDG